MGSVPFWHERLQRAGIQTQLENEVVRFADEDGLEFEILEAQTPAHVAPWTGVIASEFALSGMAGVTLELSSAPLTAAVLERNLGFSRESETELMAPSGDFVRLVANPNAPRAQMGSGGVHHVAFRAHSDQDQHGWQVDLGSVGLGVSPVMNRDYFRSLYFREPGGVLFEIATDEPGFTLDEPLETLGQSLKLPAQFEPHRAQIQARLAPLRLPEVK